MNRSSSEDPRALSLLKVTVLEIHGDTVKLGFEVDSDVPVHRLEVWERIHSYVPAEHPAES